MTDAITETPRRPKVGVTSMVNYAGRLLTGIRKGSHAAGQRAFPGGHQEWWRTWEQTAVDETFEETGLTVRPSLVNPEVGPYLFVTDSRMAADDKHYTTVWIPCTPTIHVSVFDTIPGKEPDKCEEWTWLTLDELIQEVLNTQNYTYEDILAQSEEQKHWLPLTRIMRHRKKMSLIWPKHLHNPPPNFFNI